MHLHELGYTEAETDALTRVRADRRDESLAPARVVLDQNLIYTVAGESGEFEAVPAGRMKHEARGRGGRSRLPVVGDWLAVALSPQGRAVVQAVLPRRSKLARRAVGGGGGGDFGGREDEQVLAANVDTVFIVGALDGGRNFNLRRIERYITLARAGGVAPVVVLNKADCCDDADECAAEARAAAPGVPVHTVSALRGDHLRELGEYCGAGRTVALLGPSGVGKSTIVNRLLGDELLPTGEIRESDLRGRHTTVRREMLFLPNGGMVIDTPGLRDVQLWAEEETVSASFPELEEIELACKFSDCRHDTEPGCAVRAAIESGALDELRVASYLQQRAELANRAMRVARGPGLGYGDSAAPRKLKREKRKFLKELE